jgi:hypothetical protein
VTLSQSATSFFSIGSSGSSSSSSAAIVTAEWTLEISVRTIRSTIHWRPPTCSRTSAMTLSRASVQGVPSRTDFAIASSIPATASAP